MNKRHSFIPIYNSRGDVEVFLVYPHLFNMQGEWVGFITPEQEVYSVLGIYVGYLNNDHRLLRKRTIDIPKPILVPPMQPDNVYPPAAFPLAPLMSELYQDTLDVLLDEPERLHTVDEGDLRKEID